MRLILFILLNLLLNEANAQISSSYKWTWIHGDNVLNQFGKYGQKGVESPLNKPGARGYSSSWTDAAGNFWLFGGYGYSSHTMGSLNDLWRYNPATNQWTWVAGDSVANANGAWGNVGEEGINFRPTAREGAVSWTDATKTELYLATGWSTWAGFVFHGDVWSFSTINNQWRLVKAGVVDSGGNCFGQAFGGVGEFRQGVWPVCRAGATAASDGSFAYVFGGNTPFAALYDLYQFSDLRYLPANQWAYLADTKLNHKGTYRSSHPEPGSRYAAMSFVYNNNFYLFGGLERGGGSERVLGDLWMYYGTDAFTKKPLWRWMHGDSLVNTLGKYGSVGIPDNTNKPPARPVATITPEGNGRFILFGGGVRLPGYDYMFNDVWCYDAPSNIWTWLKGTNRNDTQDRFTLANFGTKGVQSASNEIGSKQGHATWIRNGEMYVFGGDTPYGKSSDLWKFSPAMELVSIDAVSQNEICAGSPLTVSYSVHPQGSNPFDDTNRFIVELSNVQGEFINPTAIGSVNAKISGAISISIPSNSASGQYKIRIRSQSPAFTSESFSELLQVNAIPSMPVITQNGSVLVSSVPTGNQWFFNGAEIEGATASQYAPDLPGNYSVQVNLNGCPGPKSQEFSYVVTAIGDRGMKEAIAVYPNPFHDKVIIENKENEFLTVEVHDLFGREIAKATSDRINCELNLSSLANGLYIVRITGKNRNNSINKIIYKK